MLAQRFGLLQNADVDLGPSPLREVRHLDGARESRRPRPDNQDIEFHAVAGAGGAFLEDQPIERQRRLVLRRNEPLPALCSLSHGAS